MRVYTFSEARQQLATLLNQARMEGAVRIRRRDGQEFIVQPAKMRSQSPFDVAGLDLGIPLAEIASIVQDSRRSGERFVAPRKPDDRPRRRRRRKNGR